MGVRYHSLKSKIKFDLITQENLTDDILNKLHEIDVSANPSPWSYDDFKSLIDERTFCLGLFLNKDLIGFAIVSIIFTDAELYSISISHKYQGLGFGHKLLLQALHISKQRGATKCFLEVRESNQVALYLYDLYGFVINGTRKNYYPATSTTPTENAYTMECDLTKIPELVLDPNVTYVSSLDQQ